MSYGWLSISNAACVISGYCETSANYAVTVICLNVNVGWAPPLYVLMFVCLWMEWMDSLFMESISAIKNLRGAAGPPSPLTIIILIYFLGVYERKRSTDSAQQYGILQKKK